MPRDADELARVPACAIVPPLRCYHRGDFPSRLLCGDTARWMRAGSHWFAAEYFCDAHRLETDVAIPDVFVFRRVKVGLIVRICGPSVAAPLAHLEAVTRLEQAVTAAGGVLEIEWVRSDVVKSPPRAPKGTGISASGVVR